MTGFKGVAAFILAIDFQEIWVTTVDSSNCMFAQGNGSMVVDICCEIEICEYVRTKVYVRKKRMARAANLAEAFKTGVKGLQETDGKK